MRISMIATTSLIAMAASTLAASATTPRTPTVRDQAEALCYSDVMRLCNEAVPNEEQIAACMEVKRPQLSAQCRDVYDQASQAAN